MGGQYVAEQVEELRRRLLEGTPMQLGDHSVTNRPEPQGRRAFRTPVGLRVRSESVVPPVGLEPTLRGF